MKIFNEISGTQLSTYYLFRGKGENEPFKRFVGCRAKHESYGYGVVENILTHEPKVFPVFGFKIMFASGNEKVEYFNSFRLGRLYKEGFVIYKKSSMANNAIPYRLEELTNICEDLIGQFNNGETAAPSEKLKFLIGCKVKDKNKGFGVIHDTTFDTEKTDRSYTLGILFDNGKRESVTHQFDLTIYRNSNIINSLNICDPKEIDYDLYYGNAKKYLGCIVYEKDFGFGFVTELDQTGRNFVMEFEFYNISLLYENVSGLYVFNRKFTGSMDEFISLVK